jgi:hypothetical protein
MLSLGLAVADRRYDVSHRGSPHVEDHLGKPMLLKSEILHSVAAS